LAKVRAGIRGRKEGRMELKMSGSGEGNQYRAVPVSEGGVRQIPGGQTRTIS